MLSQTTYFNNMSYFTFYYIVYSPESNLKICFCSLHKFSITFKMILISFCHLSPRGYRLNAFFSVFVECIFFQYFYKVVGFVLEKTKLIYHVKHTQKRRNHC